MERNNSDQVLNYRLRVRKNGNGPLEQGDGQLKTNIKISGLKAVKQKSLQKFDTGV